MRNSKSTISTPEQKFTRQLNLLLTVILFVMVAGYFTWSENVAITRVIKVCSRLLMTVAIIFMEKRIVRFGAIASYRWSQSLSPLLYIGYLLLGFASLLWSTNPGYSLLQWIMDVESLVFAWYFVRCLTLVEQFFPDSGIRFYHIFGNACFFIVAIFICGVIIAPDVFYRLTHGGEEARLGGWMMNPNELGMLCVITISCFIFNLYRRHQIAYTIIKILIVLVALVLTGSRSSMIGFLLIVFFHIKRSKNTKLKLTVNALGLLSIPVIIETIFIKQGDLEEVLSMTGRLPFWKALITEGLPREPWLGFGFMRIDYKETFQSVHTYAGHMTHNTFIQVLMNLGFIGFMLAITQFVLTIKAFFHTKPEEKKLMLIGILIPTTINSFTEFGIFGETNYGILFYQLLIFMASVQISSRFTKAELFYLNLKRPQFYAFKFIGK